LTISTLEDRPPHVVLRGAPRRISLRDMKRTELEFFAQDDYGLSSIELVITSGRREERTELARLDGSARSYRGGHALASDHPLLRGAFLPVRVVIEARDNDSVGEPNRGVSEAITLVPQPLGARLGKRHEALRSFRQRLTLFLSE